MHEVSRNTIAVSHKTLTQLETSYSADRISEGTAIRKPVEFEGKLYAATSIQNNRVEAYVLVPREEFIGAPRTYHVPAGRESEEYYESLRNDPNGFYNGMLVKRGKGDWVLVGPEVTFINKGDSKDWAKSWENKGGPRMTKAYSSGKIDQVQLDDLKRSEGSIGQIYPVLKNTQGEIIDGFHRKRVKPDWKELRLPVKPGIETIKLRVHLNIMRRDIERGEKEEWISQTKGLLQEQDKKGTQKEIAEALGISREWVKKYDPVEHQVHTKSGTAYHFFDYNVWGFKDESWRQLIIEADPNQPWPKGYHGATPAFVIHQLIKMFQPKRVLDSMAGVGTTGYVSKQYGIPCDQYDLYPFPQYGVQQQDAEAINGSKTYDLIFNHVPYLSMVKYGDNPEDLSHMDDAKFYHKMKRIFARNLELLAEAGIYAILVGDWRRGGKLVPLTAKVALMGIEAGFTLYDMAIKLTGEMKSKELQEYRAAKFGYLAQTYDTVLIFRKSD